MLFCLANTKFEVDLSTFSLQSLVRGGGIFSTAGEAELVPDGGSSPLTSNNFFQPAAQFQLSPVESVHVQDVLGSDPYYATSYAARRYDDLVVDEEGLPIGGIVDLALSYPAPGGPSPRADNGTQYRALLQAAAAAGRSAQGNCFLLTGRWQAFTRYQMRFAVRNPPATLAAAVPALPALWVAALDHVLTAAADSTGLRSVRFTVRGSKQGKACRLRSALQASVPSLAMFDACAQPGSGGGNDADACLSALQAARASNPSLSGTYPYNVPPLSSASLNLAQPDSNACSQTQGHTTRLGGECIECGSGARTAGAACACPANVVTHLAGETACGPLLSASGNATNTASLAAELCSYYSGQYEKLLNGTLAAPAVRGVFLRSFAARAARLLDWGDLLQHSASFAECCVSDERLPWSTTRQLSGVAPHCNKCDADGKFKDIYTGDLVPAYDEHFAAVNTLRLFGYALTKQGYACPALWDAAEPRRWMYGYYDKELCVAFGDDVPQRRGLQQTSPS